MVGTHFSRKNLDFTLFDVLEIELLAQFDYFNAHDSETFSMVLDAATDIAEKIMKPAFVDSDRNQPELLDGQVKVHQGVHDYYKAFSEIGLLSAPFSFDYGGQQLPKVVAAAAEFICGGAHNSFVMYSDLTKGAANLILTFGSDEQKEQFARKMLSGEWTGTMCLTETQAGSSLSDVATTATPQPDGTYRIKGQKIFISAGDHDLTDNIIHLVLARIDGAPKGTKGISLFIVPKNRLNTEGGHLVSNDVVSIGIYHKMGQKATPAMHLEFGGQNDCVGYLLGEANRGLPQMFLMMNGARLGVGMGGIHIASAAYYASLQYATERPQGRRLNEKNALGEPTTIVHHPDVRRMLLQQKAIVEGGLCLILMCYKFLDIERAEQDPSVKQYYNDLLELLTPVAKTFGAEMGMVATNQGLQVLGGYGYTEDFILEQLARDVRIMSLYEGTTGIQAQAVLGRQIPRNGGKAIDLWLTEVRKDIEKAQNDDVLQTYATLLETNIAQWHKTTQHLLSLAAKGDAEIFLADATLYLELFGILNVAWIWLKQGIAAQKTLSIARLSEDALQFYQSKVHTMRYYYHYELPKAQSLTQRLTDDTNLTLFDNDFEPLC
ncbi:MAG: acyl-CoA dehydrogenase [Saprospiraceae bacterium]|nr:acyl-CoA dehydrogenase [Saprospiraceae bacterium]